MSVLSVTKKKVCVTGGSNLVHGVREDDILDKVIFQLRLSRDRSVGVSRKGREKSVTRRRMVYMGKKNP